MVRHVSEVVASRAFIDLMDALDMLDCGRYGSLTLIAGRSRRKFCFLEFVTGLTKVCSNSMSSSSADSQL